MSGFLYHPNGPATLMHIADHDRLGAVIGALCGEREFSRSCNLPLGCQVCGECSRIEAALRKGEVPA